LLEDAQHPLSINFRTFVTVLPRLHRTHPPPTTIGAVANLKRSHKVAAMDAPTLRFAPHPRFRSARLGRNLAVALGCLAIASCATPPASPPSPLPDPLAAGWEGQQVCELLRDDARQRVLRCTFPPGIGHERHFHAPNFGYALSGGRVRITDPGGTREVDLATGSSFWSDGTAWHEIVNIGDTTVVYLIVEPK